MVFAAVAMQVVHTEVIGQDQHDVRFYGIRRAGYRGTCEHTGEENNRQMPSSILQHVSRLVMLFRNGVSLRVSYLLESVSTEVA